MPTSDLVEDLSLEARTALAKHNRTNPAVDDALLARITGFRRGKRVPDETDPASGTPDSTKTELDQRAFASLKAQVLDGLERLEEGVRLVLRERRDDERAAKRWIFIVGIIVIALILMSLAAPFVLEDSASIWVTGLLSSLSVGGLLYLLYSPVQRTMAIANDRMNLQLIPMTVRVRLLAATTVEEIRAQADDLHEALRSIEKDDLPEAK
jgi:hypothetical protein